MPLDEKDLEQLKALMAGQIAEATKANNAELFKAMNGIVGTAIQGLEIDKKLEGLKPQPAPEPKPKDPEPEPEPNPKDPTQSVAVRKALAQLEEANKRAQEMAKKAEEAESQRKAEAESVAIRDALTAAGADSQQIHLAMLLIRDRGLVKPNAKGEPCFSFKKEWGDDVIPIHEGGAAEWLRTPEGKRFVPPVQGSGTGDKAGSAPRTGPLVDPKQIALAALKRLS